MRFASITFLSFLLFTFFLGMHLYSAGSLLATEENMQGAKGAIDTANAETGPFHTCPDLLIKRGNTLMMYDTRKSLQQGTNPLLFKSMDEYIAYYNRQKQTGSTCAMLFLQEEYDTQGNQVYRVRPGPFDLGAGLSLYSAAASPTVNRQNPIHVMDASRENGPYNQNMYPGFDPSSQYQGRYTDLDKVHDSTMKSPSGSLNPADPNWVGVMGTQQAVDAGQFEENNVSIYLP